MLKEMAPISVAVKEQGGTIVTLYDSVAVFGGLSLSLTVTVKLNVPDMNGVPETTAVDDGAGAGVKVRPGGRLPAVTDQKYGVMPFEAVRVSE